MEAASFFRSEVAERSGANRAKGKDIADSLTRVAGLARRGDCHKKRLAYGANLLIFQSSSFSKL